MSLALARKYRPKTFSTLVGQDHVVRALTNALNQNRLHHAYLFTGTRGCGKTTLARILAKALNCETGITATPCGTCNACLEIDRGRFVDLLEVDAASNTQVDAMRDLLDNAQYAPTAGRFKVYIIDEVHMLSKSAFNAMLKTLEEPPAHVKFILATTDPQKVPVTVLSRCLQFNLRQMASTTVFAHLQTVLAQENIHAEPAALQLIARAAAGSMRDALSLTDQAIAYGNQTINEADVRAMLGAIDQSYLFEILQALQAGNGELLIEKAKQMEARSLSFEAALNDLASLLHQISIAQTVPKSIADDLPERAQLLDLSEKIAAESLQLYYQIALLGRRDLTLAPDEFAGFSMTLLRMLAFTPQEAAKAANTANRASAPAALALKVPMAPAIETPIASPQESPKANAPEQEKPNENANQTASPQFNGDWRGLVENHLKLGLARALALQCELVSYDEHSMQLRVTAQHKHLINANYQQKLAEAINQFFGKKIALSIAISDEANTPAMQKTVEKAELQNHTETAILQDPFVQGLMQNLGATIIPNSIKPIN